MIASKTTAIAYETIRDAKGTLPLLTPMSEVAGRMSIQEGAKFLERPQEGRGILLAGVPGVAPAEVAVLGGGIVGSNAAKMAAGMGANVRILDVNLDRLRYLDDIMPPNVTTLYSDRHTILESVERAGPGHRRDPDHGRPRPSPRPPGRPGADGKSGAVIVDVAIDQGGCIETSRPTTHREPTYVVDGVVHYCVTNMAGRRGADLDVCPQQRDLALRPPTGPDGLARDGVQLARLRRRGEYRPGSGHESGGGQYVRASPMWPGTPTRSAPTARWPSLDRSGRSPQTWTLLPV